MNNQIKRQIIRIFIVVAVGCWISGVLLAVACMMITHDGALATVLAVGGLVVLKLAYTVVVTFGKNL